ncbi:RAMP superfamily CRISPR-associated protein [Paraferrimonas haliotis]|uniref:RAMP superfamily CRISPR-associated protein n=1 Tax=Paraferrimonas haliotis TaxID=2013866 RepID=UPI000BA9709B|nr:RAMP superfamily CRISPR-associated protein [Paraferrimonas haliotis]
MTHIYQYKLTIETTAPLAINTGKRETGFDTELARDVNNLPYIPATAIAGVWSHLVEAKYGLQCQQDWFGCIAPVTKPSKLIIFDGKVLDSRSKAVANFADPTALQQDTVLSRLIENRPHHRERVSLNDRGVAKDTGKFDELLLPSGVRFSIEFLFHADSDADFAEVLALWTDKSFAFGSSTTNGLGQFKIVGSNMQCVDLAKGAKEADKLAEFKANIPVTNKISFADTQSIKLASLQLQAMDNWRYGTGTVLLGHSTPEHNVNVLPYSEPVITWNAANHASFKEDQVVLCGSSIKGMLAHRLYYHYRRLTGDFAENYQDSDFIAETRPAELNELLGFSGDSPDLQLAGNMIFSDSLVEYQHTVIRHHNQIDRFTGGVRDGALYSEELLYQPNFNVDIWLKRPITDDTIKAALKATLEDIQAGLLPMGAGSGRGTSLVMQNSRKPSFINNEILKSEANS